MSKEISTDLKANIVKEVQVSWKDLIEVAIDEKEEQLQREEKELKQELESLIQEEGVALQEAAQPIIQELESVITLKKEEEWKIDEGNVYVNFSTNCYKKIVIPFSHCKAYTPAVEKKIANTVKYYKQARKTLYTRQGDVHRLIQSLPQQAKKMKVQAVKNALKGTPDGQKILEYFNQLIKNTNLLS